MQSDTMVLGCGEVEEWKLPVDETRQEWAQEKASLLPALERGVLKLLSAKTWETIDTIKLDPGEIITHVKILDLEVSEHTHERRPLIAVSTAFIRGEDLPSKGSIHLYSVIPVVPEPDRPETNRRLKLMAREETKGAVTALTGIGRGFLLNAQGQKVMVRGLKEDGTLLPMAFLDVQCYVSVAESLPGEGLAVLGDAMKGVWFVGYSVSCLHTKTSNPLSSSPKSKRLTQLSTAQESPHRIEVFGRSSGQIPIQTAALLPHGNSLHIPAVDLENTLHVLHFDPENPKSMGGQRLLHRASFSLGGHMPMRIRLLPSTLSNRSSSAADPSGVIDGLDDNPDVPRESVEQRHVPTYQLLMPTCTGALSLLTPLGEQSYRRMSSLQQNLTNTLESHCGLNPRAYRYAVGADGLGAAAGAGDKGHGVAGGVVDGTVLRRWAELGSWRRKEVLSRSGVDEWSVGADLDIVLGRGLGFL